MSRLNRHGYTELIEGNRKWLAEQPQTLERDHIDMALVDSIDRHYGGPTYFNLAELRHLWEERAQTNPEWKMKLAALEIVLAEFRRPVDDP